MALIITMVIILLAVVVLLIITNLPQLCILGTCWTPIERAFSQKINFYFAILLWFIIQAIIIYLYYKLVKFSLNIPKTYSDYIEKFVTKFKGLFEK